MAAQVPPYLSPGQIGRACGVSRRAATTELRNAGLLDRRGQSPSSPGRWRISASQLRERLPDYYERVFEFFVLNAHESGSGRPG